MNLQHLPTFRPLPSAARRKAGTQLSKRVSSWVRHSTLYNDVLGKDVEREVFDEIFEETP